MSAHIPHALQPSAHVDVLATVPFDATATELFEGGGLAVVDLNDDGHLDLVLSGADAPALLWGTSKGFTPADASVLPSAPDRGVGVTAADVDGDGDLDLFLARYRRPNLLWRNDGDRFVDITKAAGVSGETNARTVTASFHDIDHDGILDLFVGNFGPFFAQDRPPGEPSELYRGMGDGTFVPWDAPSPPQFKMATCSTADGSTSTRTAGMSSTRCMTSAPNIRTRCSETTVAS